MTSLETLYCLKEFRIADIPLSGVSGVMGAVCCVMCTEVVWEMVGRSRVGCKVTVELGEIIFCVGHTGMINMLFPLSC